MVALSSRLRCCKLQCSLTARPNAPSQLSEHSRHMYPYHKRLYHLSQQSNMEAMQDSKEHHSNTDSTTTRNCIAIPTAARGRIRPRSDIPHTMGILQLVTVVITLRQHNLSHSGNRRGNHIRATSMPTITTSSSSRNNNHRSREGTANSCSEL